MTKTIPFSKSFNMNFEKLFGRIRWVTIRRKDRKSREVAYQNRVAIIKAVGNEMWRAVYPNSSPLEWKVGFKKHDASMMFFAEHECIQSDWYYLGLDEDNAYDFCKCESDESISYWTSEYFTAANIIAEIKARDENPPEELIHSVLTRYFEHKSIDAAGKALTWVNRLNSIVCDLYQQAPIFVEALRLVEHEGLNHKDSRKKAWETVQKPELPLCIHSVALPGRCNMSYSYDRSRFYTVDHRGETVCREFPNERLNLSDYKTLKRVAYSIVKDIRKGDKSGLGDTLYLFEKEPEWKNDYIMPEDSEPMSLNAS